LTDRLRGRGLQRDGRPTVAKSLRILRWVESSVSMTKPTRIFFMHISKTAGSYVNDVFMKSIGADKCFVHCEEKMQDASIFREMLADKVFVSGHVYYRDWARLSGELNSEFLKITLIRNPIKHLKSYLLYFNSFKAPDLREGFRLRGPDMNEVLDEISMVDFADPLSIKKFMDSLSPTGTELFNNCQSRFFLCTKVRDPHMPLNRNHKQLLLSVLSQFDLIGLSENPAFFLTEVERLSGIKLDIHNEIINKTVSSSDIDLDNYIVGDVLKRDTEVEEFLYTTVLQQTTQALYARVAELQSRVAAADARTSKAEGLGSGLKSQLSRYDDRLRRSAAELDGLRAELAEINAGREAVATSLPWRIARTIRRIVS
jgi:hypothetical protein